MMELDRFKQQINVAGELLFARISKLLHQGRGVEAGSIQWLKNVMSSIGKEPRFTEIGFFGSSLSLS